MSKTKLPESEIKKGIKMMIIDKTLGNDCQRLNCQEVKSNKVSGENGDQKWNKGK